MIVDTSAWLEYLRATDSPADAAITRMIDEDADLFVPELVVMELQVGSGDERHARALGRLLRSLEVIPIAPIVDTERAASLQRQCRRAGRTVRNMVDCMIAAMAVRLGEPVLHRDRDFDVLAAHTELEVVSLG